MLSPRDNSRLPATVRHTLRLVGPPPSNVDARQILLFDAAHRLRASVQCDPDPKRVRIFEMRAFNELRGRRR